MKRYHALAAEVPGHGYGLDVVGSFDPRVVLARLSRIFPTIEVFPEDCSQRNLQFFQWHGLKPGVGSALADAQRRGPLWWFQIKLPSCRLVGKVERYLFEIRGEPTLPEDLRSQLLPFLEGLRFAPYVTIDMEREAVHAFDPAKPPVRPFSPNHPRLTLVMIRVADLAKSSRFYYCIGLDPQLEKHGSGPEHYAGQLGDTVIELYPMTGPVPASHNTIRLGFEVASIRIVLQDLQKAGLVSPSNPSLTEVNSSITIQDPDGNSIALTEPDSGG